MVWVVKWQNRLSMTKFEIDTKYNEPPLKLNH